MSRDLYVQDIESGVQRTNRLVAKLNKIALLDPQPEDSTTLFNLGISRVWQLGERTRQMRRQIKLNAAADRATNKLDCFEYNALAMRVRDQYLSDLRDRIKSGEIHSVHQI